MVGLVAARDFNLKVLAVQNSLGLLGSHVAVWWVAVLRIRINDRPTGIDDIAKL